MSVTKLREVAISDFKARCSSLLDGVYRRKITLRVTRRGKPIVDIVPAPAAESGKGWLGSMAGTAEIVGDIISPVIDLEDIEALKDREQ